jgi:hypothetical protein
MARNLVNDGSTDNISGTVLGAPANASVGSSWATSFWYARVALGGSRNFVGNTNGSSNGWFHSNSGGFFNFVVPGIGTASSALTVPTDNTWHHYVSNASSTSNAGSVSLFKDGVADVSNPFSLGAPGFGVATGNFSVNVGNNSSAGLWADIVVYPYQLTLTEIKALAFGIRPGAIARQQLQLWWPLDGLQSPEPDLSGHANNGTLTATTLGRGPPFAPFTRRWPQFTPTPPPQISISYQRAQQILMTGP